VEGNNATSDSGPADMDTMYVSYDGAASWNALPVPAGITFTSALSCASAGSCAAGALFNGQPVLAVTANGAHSWTLDPLPAGPSQIFQLSCPTTTTCVGLATASAIIKGAFLYPPYMGTRFLITTDGGASFAASASPPGESMFNLSCPTARDCVAIGARDRDRYGYVNEPGVVAISHDGGATWSSRTLPQNQGGLFPPLTCVDASHCYTLGAYVAVRYSGGSWSPGSDLLATADGGRTWTVRRLPARIPLPQLDGLACPSDSMCYASGSEAIPERVYGGDPPRPGGAVNGSSPVVVITHDAGRTWSRVAFAVPAHVPPAVQADPNAFLTIGDIQCPQPNACIAFGGASQGSRSTAVYTYTSTP
jgi:BNR/Asp-box repeat